jgi:hypothetical protein
MKKNINLDNILDYIAVEKVPDDLIDKWKAEIAIQKERRTVWSVLLRPSIVFSIIIAGLWYYFIVFKETFMEYGFLDKACSVSFEISPAVADSITAAVSSNYYIISVSIFSVLVAAVSLLWFYQGKRSGYSIVRNW